MNGSPDTDENGHGTHVAGTIAGRAFGVSKQASLVAVKVLDINGTGSASSIMTGLTFGKSNSNKWNVDTAADLGI